LTNTTKAITTANAISKTNRKKLWHRLKKLKKTTLFLKLANKIVSAIAQNKHS